MDQRRAWSMVDWQPWLAMELTGAWHSSRSRPWRLATRWGKEGGRRGESNLGNTEAWKAARRRRRGGRTSARKGGSVGAMRAKRRSVGGVGVFTEGGVAFYATEVTRGRSGAFNVRR
jgi:hypothetical protein